MAKVKNWLFSMQAKGHLGHQLTGQGSLGGQRVQPYRKPGGKPSERQEARRSNWKEGMRYWRSALYASTETWDAWNVSRSMEGKKETSLSLFMKQWDKVEFYAKNYYMLVLTKVKLFTKTGVKWIQPVEGMSGTILPMSAEGWKYKPFGDKWWLYIQIGGVVIDEGWDYFSVSDFEVGLTFDVESAIVYGKYSDGFTESEEFPIMPVLIKKYIFEP